MKIVECEEKGLSFEEVVSEVEKYIEEMNTFFCVGETWKLCARTDVWAE